MTLALTPISDISQLSPIDGSFLMFQDTDFGKRTYNLAAANNGAGQGVNTGGDMLPVQPIITESTLSVEGNKIAIQNLKNNPTPNRPAQGELMVVNGFQVQCTETGIEEIWRNITQDPNPAVTYRGGGSQPAEHTVVASASLGTQTTPVTHTVVAIPGTFTFGVKLKATLSNSPTLSAGATEGTVTITGQDLNGNTQTDILRWTASTLSTAALQTPRYFDPTQTVTVVSKGFATGNVVVTVNDPSKTITYTPNRFPENFLSFEVNQGGKVPQAFMDGILSQLEFGVAMDSIIANCGVLAGYGRVRQNINGGTTPTPLSTGVSRTSATPYTGVEAYLEIGGTRIAMDSVNVSIVGGFEMPFYHDYSLWPESRPRRNALRMITVNATLPYDAAQDLETNYLQNEQIDDVKVVMATGAKGTFGAYQSELITHLIKGFQVSMPSAQGSGVTPLTQNLVIESFTDGSENDFQIISNQKDLPYTLYNAA